MSTSLFVDLKQQLERQIKTGRQNSNPKQFFDTIQKLWNIADKYNIPLPFTNFVLFGPQSVGKSTLIERIIGFPITVVRTGVGTARPLIIKTLHSDEDYVEVYATEPDGTVSEAIRIEPEEVSEWVQEKNDAGEENPVISDKPIFLTVAGPDRHPSRFVDLPGYQLNGPTAPIIKQLLVKELSDPNTIIVAIGTTEDVQTSVLVKSLHKIFTPGKVPTGRMIFCINKSEQFFQTGSEEYKNPKGATKFLMSYAKKEYFGVVPYLVGSSIKFDKDNSPIPRNSMDHNELSEMYRGADRREEDVINLWLAKMRGSSDFGSFPYQLLKEQLFGFQTMLSHINDVIVERDTAKLNIIRVALESKLRTIQNDKETLELEKKELDNFADNLHNLVAQFLQIVHCVQFPDGGHALQALVSDDSVFDATNLGLTLNDEETIFYQRYEPSAKFTGQPLTFHKQYEADATTVRQWLDYISAATVPNVDFSDRPMVSGDIYGRLQNAWAAHVYQFNKPSQMDLDRLANLHGFSHEMSMDEAIKRAKRLTEIYANRLRPAIHYYCWRNVFIIQRMFEAAWTLLLRHMDFKTTLHLFGNNDELHDLLEVAFEEAVRKYAHQAYQQVFADLDCEITKLFPYQANAPVMQGLVAAYPLKEKELMDGMDTYLNKELFTIPEELKKNRPKLFSASFSVSLSKIWVGSEQDDADSNDIYNIAVRHNPKRNERLLGFSCGLYAHFLPRFINTVLGRFQGDLWGCTKNADFQTTLLKPLKRSVTASNIEDKKQRIEDTIAALKEQETSLEGALKMLQEFRPSNTSASKIISKPTHRSEVSRAVAVPKSPAVVAKEPVVVPKEPVVVDVAKRLQDHIPSSSTRVFDLKSSSKDDAGARDRLQKRLKEYSLTIVDGTDAQGNCQFDSIADQLRRLDPATPYTHQQVRQQIVDWLRGNGQFATDDSGSEEGKLEKFVTEPWDDYVNRMAGENVWGDNVTLFAAVEVFGYPIVIISDFADDDERAWKLKVTPKDKDKAQRNEYICLAHQHEVHYFSLLLTS